MGKVLDPYDISDRFYSKDYDVPSLTRVDDCGVYYSQFADADADTDSARFYSRRNYDMNIADVKVVIVKFKEVITETDKSDLVSLGAAIINLRDKMATVRISMNRLEDLKNLSSVSYVEVPNFVQRVKAVVEQPVIDVPVIPDSFIVKIGDLYRGNKVISNLIILSVLGLGLGFGFWLASKKKRS